MLSAIGNIFSLVSKVLGIYAMIISLTELDPDCETGEQKLEKAKQWLNERLDDLEERGVIPGWARSVFFGARFSEWIISVLVNVAHKLGFFEREDD